MELQGNVGLLSNAPPKLEDAGLEDCALPIEGVQVSRPSDPDLIAFVTLFAFYTFNCANVAVKTFEYIYIYILTAVTVERCLEVVSGFYIFFNQLGRSEE